MDGVLSTYAFTLVADCDSVIARAAAALAPRGRFVIVDVKAPDGWSDRLLRASMPLVRPFGVELELRDRHPWESLAKHMELVTMEERYLGTTYIAVGENPQA